MDRKDTNERARLAALYKTELLDTDYEQDFDDLVLLASVICKTPISTLTLIDADRQWFKAKIGLDKRQDDRAISICAHTIAGSEPLIIADTFLDPRFAANPLVTGEPNIRYYAGVPITSTDGHNIGSICVIDRTPRLTNAEEILALQALARKTSSLIELRMKKREVEAANFLLQRLNSITAHDVRNAIGPIKQLLLLHESRQLDTTQVVEMFPQAQKQLDSTLNLLNNLMDWGKLQLNSSLLALPENLCELIDGCIEEFSLAATMKGNILANDVPYNSIIVCEKAGLSFVIRNLLSNAVKFTANGTITISYEQQNHLHIILIADTGVGMNLQDGNPGEIHVQHKQRPGTDKENGSGVGLKLVKEYLRKVHGSLHFTGTVNGGTTVIISLPAL